MKDSQIKYKTFMKFMNGYNSTHKTSGFLHTGTMITQAYLPTSFAKPIKSYLVDNYNQNIRDLKIEKKSLMDELKRKSFYESGAKYESPEKLAFIERMKKKIIKQGSSHGNGHRRVKSFNSVKSHHNSFNS